MPTLIDDLGGPHGFGTVAVPRNDDGGTAYDLSAAFPDGLRFGTATADAGEVWINTNGTISFGWALPGHGMADLLGAAGPVIAPFAADVDTRLRGEGRESGQIWLDIDAPAGIATVTWHEVGFFRRNTELTNTFQVEISHAGGTDADVTFRYGQIDWLSGDLDGGIDGLGGDLPLAGLYLGDGQFDALHIAATQQRWLDAPIQPGDVGPAGVWTRMLRGGISEPVGLIGDEGANTLQARPGGDRVFGVGGDNVLLGGPGDDLLFPGGGHDVIRGGGGQDIVVFSGARSDYDITAGPDGSILVSARPGGAGREGVTTLEGIPLLRFGDETLRVDALDPGPPSGADPSRPDQLAPGDGPVILSGTVQGPDGAAIAGAWVHFIPQGAQTATHGMRSGPDGGFELGLATGATGRLGAVRAYDPDTDPAVTAVDALDVLRLAVGLAPGFGAAAPETFVAADIDQDGQVTATDALEVLRHAVGLPASHEPRWIFHLGDAGGPVGHSGPFSLPDDGPGIRSLDTDAAVTLHGILLGNIAEL